ncbi:MAG: sodium:solute symporter [Saprospiraceae bacterium]|nr:sodium:solute symporter [Saprospiraceae bacterium]
MNFTFTTLDLVIIVGYILAIVAYGFYHRKAGSSEEYFLAGRNMPWYVIGISMFSANISSNSLIAITGGAYKGGIVFFNYEWMASVVLAFFCVFILPFYLRTGVYTMPEFFEKRYDARSRYYFSFITLIGNIFIDTAGTLFAGVVIAKLVYPEANTFLIVLLLAMFAAGYTIFGGLSSVMRTEMVNTIILLISAVILAFIVYDKAGGYQAIVDAANAKDPSFMHLVQPSNHPDMPWQGLLLGVPLLGFYFWCNNQFIVQRALSARDANEARKGALFAALLKIPILFLLVLPGIAAIKLYPDLQEMYAGQLKNYADGAYPTLVFKLLPAGLVGLVVAGFLAAMASAVSATLNSASTLVTMDFVQKLRPGLSSQGLVRAGQIATVGFMLITVAWAPQIANFESLMNYMQSVLALISPPVVAIFLLGLFWKRANADGAFAALMAGLAMALFSVASQVYELSPAWNQVHFLVKAPILLAVCMTVQLVVSLATAPPPAEKIVGMIWTPQVYAEDSIPLQGVPWYQNYRVLAVLLLILTFAVVFYYR